MIESLFGDLAPRSLPPSTGREPRDATDTRAAAGAAVPVHQHLPVLDVVDVVVDSSPAAAMRRHFASHRGNLGSASPMITLLDPSQLWARQVVQALSDAACAPLQRLNLRERGTLRTLAVIERTVVPRRGQQPLRVYCADIRASQIDQHLQHDEIATALAEGSQFTAVLVGSLQPQALTALLASLLAACRQPQWLCPQLLFLVPPGVAGLHQRILAQPWPAGVEVEVVAEPLGSASSVWNRLLSAWEQRGQRPVAGRQAQAGTQAVQARPAAPAGGLHAPPAAPGAAAAATSATRPPQLALQRLLWPMQHTDGLLACGVVDLHSGDLLASHVANLCDTDTSALAEASQALWAARQAHRLALPGQALSDEILVTTGAQQMLLRSLPSDSALGFVALVARAQANLALLRFKLLEVDQLLRGDPQQTR